MFMDKQKINVNNIESEEPTKLEQSWKSRYFREFMPAIAGYSLSIFVITAFTDLENDTAKYVVLIPGIFLLGAIIAFYRFFIKLDELGQLIHLKSLAIGFAAYTITTLIFALESLALDVPGWTNWITYSIGMAAWAISGVFQVKKFG